MAKNRIIFLVASNIFHLLSCENYELNHVFLKAIFQIISFSIVIQRMEKISLAKYHIRK